MDALPEFPLPQGWNVNTLTAEQARCMFQGSTMHDKDQFQKDCFPLLESRARVVQTGPVRRDELRMKGWQRPGPGPNPGRSRVPSVEALTNPFLLALIHLTKEAIHFQQLYSFQSNVHENEGFSFSTAMMNLDQLEKDLPVSKAMRRCIWTTTHQLGVPAFLVKLRSPYHAISLTFLPDRAGRQWACSQCTWEEVNMIQNCVHASLLNQCLQKVAEHLDCSTDFILCSMTQSSAFNQVSDLTSTCFYGTAKKIEFAITRNEQSTFHSSATSGTRLHIARRTPNTKHWRCLTRACAGNNSDCIHCRAVHEHVQRGLTHCIPSIYDLVHEQENHNPTFDNELDMEPSQIPVPRHFRPLIPSETAFQIDSEVNRNSRNNSPVVLKAAVSCHCGGTIYDETSSVVFNCELRVETHRCHTNYRQEVWTCRRGHLVTPEECEETREGLLWISRDTAYTEVFLFDLLLHMTLGGGTINGQSDIRSQLLFLQTDYMSRQQIPRSNQCIRKALIMYSMAVVKAIPAWVFRCNNCGVQSDGSIYYDKLSFDGQQLGFNIRRDVRYDFYGKPATPWRRPVDRCSEATSLAMLIKSRSLRAIITESLRVRGAPPNCASVHSLCRTMMKLSLHTKNAVRAAVAAIKLFDPIWTAYLPPGAPKINDSTFDAFSTTSDSGSFAHPFHFITEVNDSSDFHRCKKVLNIFSKVLDCTKAAAMIAVLLKDLRNDLKIHIPIHDRCFITNYASCAGQGLQVWLTGLSQSNSDSWVLLLPSQNNNEAQQDVTPGIGEHAGFLEHPFRPPFAWKRVEGESTSPHCVKQLCRLRKIEEWEAPNDANTAVLLFMMALLTESVTVWLRDGELSSMKAGIEVLRNAELHAGEDDISYHCRAALQEVYGIGLLYEGIMALLGANTVHAKYMFASLRDGLEIVEERYDMYLSCMANFSSTKSFMCSPREFDDMLTWTGAFGTENRTADHPHQNHDIDDRDAMNIDTEMHHRNMSNLYEKMALSKSNDFLETGIWGPDFPVRRPSPSSTIWSNVPQTDTSCSKDFDVHHAFSPGTFGAYCLCRHAKTVIVSFLKRPEGCRMPLNLIVERCARLPKYVVYDFACGTQKSALALSAKIAKNVSFVIDPFHFPGHKTCSLAMHEANFSELRGLNMESQEQRNKSIKVMERTLRASRDIHFMHFVVLGHAYLNLKAMYLDHKDETGTQPHHATEWGSRAWIRWIRENLFRQHS